MTEINWRNSAARHAAYGPSVPNFTFAPPACPVCRDTGIVQCAETNPEDGVYEQACPEKVHRDRAYVIPDEDVTFPEDKSPSTPLSDWDW